MKITLKASLDKLHEMHRHNIGSDPIYFPYQYTDSQDREVIALISALYAFGNVKMIFNTLRNIQGFLGAHPYQTFISMNTKKLREYPFVTHRWIKSDDTRSMMLLLSKVLLEDRSLENSFMKFYSSAEKTLEGSMIQWMKHLQAKLVTLQHHPLTRGQKFLLSVPGKGSTSKRLTMFFRWMVRREEPDLGLWRTISPSQLLMPLDAHLFRFSQYLGFIKKQQSGWKAVTQATSHFRKICPDDPVKYDFALARLGIMNLCVHKAQPERCGKCPIQNHCQLWLKNL